MKLRKFLCIIAAVTVVFSLCACKKSNSQTENQIFADTSKYTSYQDEENGLYGFKDENGNVIISAQFDLAGDFCEDRAYVKKEKRFAYIDAAGNPITDYRFKIVGNFSNGLAAVSEDGKTYGFIDKDGNVAIDFLYTNVDDFDESGHAQAYFNGELITIDKTGAQVTEDESSSAPEANN